MPTAERQLLISGLADTFAARGLGGGLFVADGRTVERIDSLVTSGLAFNGRRLARCLDTSCQDEWARASRLLIYDETGLVHHLRLDGATSPHGIHYSEDAIAVVATTQNRLVWFSEDGRELRRWQAPGEEESWHLNDVVEANGRIHVCAFGRFRSTEQWREPGAPAGCVVAIDSDDEVAGGLDRPHSPRLVDGHWLVCNSGTGELVAVDPDTRRIVRRQEVGPWPRGLAVDNQRIYVGISPPRYVPDAGPASVCVLDRATWRPVDRFDVPAAEVFDLMLVPPEIVCGVRRGLRSGHRGRPAPGRRPRILQTYEHPGFGEPERTVETLTDQWLADGHEVRTWVPGVIGEGYPRDWAPDVVVVHCGLYGAAYAGLAEEVTGAPVVEIVHRRRAMRSGATARAAVSREAAAVQEPGCQVIPPGVRPLPTTMTREAARAALGFGAAELVVARHAEVTMEAGWHWTMRTMQRAWATGLDAWLLVVGDGSGPAAAVLRAWARGQARVVQRSGERPGDLLMAADLYLETSPAEGFGLAVAEAGLLGLPVVGFRAPGVSETLGRSCAMVALGDADAAAVELVRLAGDARARAELGARLRRRIAARFDPARSARRYAELCEAVIAREAST